MEKNDKITRRQFLKSALAGTAGAAALAVFGPNTLQSVHAQSQVTDPAVEISGAAANSLITNGGTVINYADLTHQSVNAPATVYFTNEITPEAMMKAYEALGAALNGNVGIKMSTGESSKSNYLRPALIGDLVHSLNGTIVECNTAYGGSRASTARHRQQAKENGLLEMAELDILDKEGSMEIPISGGTRLQADYVGSHFANYDSFLVLSHFKGHAMAGFGGAIKNISIGFGSSMGKVWIHSGGTRTTGNIFGETDPFLEAMGDAAKGVNDYMGDRIVYISVMNRLSVDCDCDGNPTEPDMHDIGILASADPLALDQACIDLVYASPDSASLRQRIESRHGLHTLDHGEEIGLGSRYYKLEQING